MNKLPALNKQQEQRATSVKKAAMIEAMRFHLGLVTQACQRAGISRTTHYKWLQDDPVYKLAIEETNEIQMDFVEGKLLQGIKNGVPAMTIFYAKTKMRSRGYQERVEVENISEPAFLLDKTAEKPVEDIMEVIHKKKTG